MTGIKPDTHSPGMFSWFPILFPLKVSRSNRKCSYFIDLWRAAAASLVFFVLNSPPPDSNPFPCPRAMTSLSVSGVATTERRSGTSGPWPSPPAPPSITRQDGPTPSACEGDASAQPWTITNAHVCSQQGGAVRLKVALFINAVKPGIVYMKWHQCRVDAIFLL